MVKYFKTHKSSNLCNIILVKSKMAQASSITFCWLLTRIRDFSYILYFWLPLVSHNTTELCEKQYMCVCVWKQWTSFGSQRQLIYPRFIAYQCLIVVYRDRLSQNDQQQAGRINHCMHNPSLPGGRLLNLKLGKLNLVSIQGACGKTIARTAQRTLCVLSSVDGLVPD